jgi:hypothetical protein
MQPVLQIPEPAVPIDPLQDSEAAVAWIEKLIVEAERQIRGMEQGPLRMREVVDVAVRTLGHPILGDREVAHLACQLIYSSIARGMPPELRSPKDDEP